MDADYGDNPIRKPEQDMFDIDGFSTFRAGSGATPELRDQTAQEGLS